MVLSMLGVHRDHCCGFAFRRDRFVPWRPTLEQAGWPLNLVRVATREQLHREVDALSESDVLRAQIIVVDEPEGEADVVGLPEAWKRFEDGTPQPNWVALRHESWHGR
jgi:hypothetical protein